MTGMRPHTNHQSRLDWWRRQIQRQPKTHLTIADFCRQLGVSVPTFYCWKRARSRWIVRGCGASVLTETLARYLPALLLTVTWRGFSGSRARTSASEPPRTNVIAFGGASRPFTVTP